MNKQIEMIKELAMAFGPSGFEDDVIEVAKKYAPAGFDNHRDSLLNFYLERPCDCRPLVLLDAHSDEIGLMVHAVKPNGTIVFHPLGGWVPNVLPAQRFFVKNLEGRLVSGIVATKPPHFGGMEEGKLTVEQMVIDIGASSKEEAELHYKIATGCPIVPDAPFEYREAQELIFGKAFDCRLGCGAVLEALEELKDERLDVNIAGVLSSQEEVGIRGAKVITNRLKPDAIICFEGTPADDTFGEGHMIQTAMGKGPMLRIIDRGMITNPRFMRFALDVAGSCDYPVQTAVRTGGGTNGSAFHLANQGIPTIVISVPVRYVHTPNAIASLRDYRQAVDLAVRVVKALNLETIKGF